MSGEQPTGGRPRVPIVQRLRLPAAVHIVLAFVPALAFFTQWLLSVRLPFVDALAEFLLYCGLLTLLFLPAIPVVWAHMKTGNMLRYRSECFIWGGALSAVATESIIAFVDAFSERDYGIAQSLLVLLFFVCLGVSAVGAGLCLVETERDTPELRR